MREEADFDAESDAVRKAGSPFRPGRALFPPLPEVLHSALFLAGVVSAWLLGVSFPVIAAFVVLLCSRTRVPCSWREAKCRAEAAPWKRADGCWILPTNRRRQETNRRAACTKRSNSTT